MTATLPDESPFEKQRHDYEEYAKRCPYEVDPLHKAAKDRDIHKKAKAVAKARREGKQSEFKPVEGQPGVYEYPPGTKFHADILEESGCVPINMTPGEPVKFEHDIPISEAVQVSLNGQVLMPEVDYVQTVNGLFISLKTVESRETKDVNRLSGREVFMIWVIVMLAMYAVTATWMLLMDFREVL